MLNNKLRAGHHNSGKEDFLKFSHGFSMGAKETGTCGQFGARVLREYDFLKVVFMKTLGPRGRDKL